MIFKWLRKKLREWLLDDNAKKADRRLSCMIRERGTTVATTYLVTGVCGLHLVGTRLGVPGEVAHLISAGQAIDPDQFRRLWKELSDGVTITWEDGDPASPIL